MIPSLLAQFAYLQLLDLLTTMAVLAIGVHEGNPIVRFLMNSAGSPLAGLAAVKVLALGLAVYCWRRGRHRLLKNATLFYAGLVAWNLVAFLLGALNRVGA
jgi:hypothetical protein